MAITLFSMIIAFGIFFVYYPKVLSTDNPDENYHGVLKLLGVCFFFAFFGPFITGDF